jgi:hypothetical protein
MGPTLASNAWKMIAVVLAGIAVVAMLGCQWQMAALDQTQTCLPTHHRAAAPQATADLHCPVRHCPVVTLPMAVSLAPVEFVLPYTTPLMAHPTEFALPPFIPPEEVQPA